MPSRLSEESLRVALDTNNLISAHINDKGPSAKILDMIYLGKVEFYSSPFQLREFARVLNYPRIKRKFGLDEQKINFYTRTLRENAHVVYPSNVPRVVAEDPDDDEILAIAVEGRVDFLVSGDRHLLDLGCYQKVPILTAQDFLDREAQISRG